jgi:hypothetical protein
MYNVFKQCEPGQARPILGAVTIIKILDTMDRLKMRPLDLWKAIDINHDRKITKQELAAGLERFSGGELQEQDIEEMVILFDMDGDGKLDVKEWKAGLTKNFEARQQRARQQPATKLKTPQTYAEVFAAAAAGMRPDSIADLDRPYESRGGEGGAGATREAAPREGRPVRSDGDMPEGTRARAPSAMADTISAMRKSSAAMAQAVGFLNSKVEDPLEAPKAKGGTALEKIEGLVSSTISTARAAERWYGQAAKKSAGGLPGSGGSVSGEALGCGAGGASGGGAAAGVSLASTEAFSLDAVFKAATGAAEDKTDHLEAEIDTIRAEVARGDYARAGELSALKAALDQTQGAAKNTRAEDGKRDLHP